MGANAAHRESLTFLAWVLVGALATFAVLSILTVGPFVLPLAAILGIITVRRSGLTAGSAGLAVGSAVPLGYVGWLNREGPGEVCRAIPHGTSCTETWSPWPWWGAAACCVVVGTALFRVLSRKIGR
jgi:hypothetical protein